MTHTGQRRTRNPDHKVWLEPSPKWVRVLFNGTFVADSRRVQLMYETGHVPVYYFPKEDIRQDLLVDSERSTH